MVTSGFNLHRRLCCELLEDAFSVSDHVVGSDGVQIDFESLNLPGGTEEIEEHFSHDNRCHSQDSNRPLPNISN
jgi:hypothetical protein